MVIVSCDAPYGKGGLGRHLEQVVDEHRAAGELEQYYAASVPAGDRAGREVRPRTSSWILQYTPVRFSPAWKIYCASEMFDRAVAARLRAGEVFHGFDGTSRHTLRQAGRLKYKLLELEGGMSHIRNVERLWKRACRMYPLERNPLHPAQVRRFLDEYESADLIWVTSEYSRQTFIEAGVPAAKLRRRYLKLPSRFTPPPQRPDDGIFRVVSTGFLSPAKGIPLLLEAFHRLTGPAELTLVGHAWTKSMQRFMEEWQRREPRLRIAPGDPLPHLQRADAYVHPSFQEGFGYAPIEALACDVPVIVTEDTGMKEHVREGVNGYVVSTGNWESILERLRSIQRNPLRAGALAEAG